MSARRRRARRRARGGVPRTPTRRSTTPAAIEVDREAPPPGRPELGFDGGAPIEGWAAAVSLGWLERPIVLRHQVGESAPVARRADPGARRRGRARARGGRRCAAAASRQQGDRLRLAGGGGEARALDRWVPGDLRLGAPDPGRRQPARGRRSCAPSSRCRPATSATSRASRRWTLGVEPDRPVHAAARDRRSPAAAGSACAAPRC